MSSRLKSIDMYIFLGLIFLTGSLGYLVMVPAVCGIFHDDAVYVSTAKALANGCGYHLINLPFSPPQTKYPILFPAMLAIIWKIWPSFPDNVVAMQYLTLTLAGLATGLSYLYLVAWNYTSRAIALIAAALAATSSVYLYYGTLVLSEIPFAVFALVALMALEKYSEGSPSPPWRQFFLGILLGLPFLTRTIGIVIIPVGSAIILWKRRPFARVALGMCLVVLPWISWSVLALHWQESPVTAYYTNYLSWWHSVTVVKSWGSVLLWNFFGICLSPIIKGVAVLDADDLFKTFILYLIIIGSIALLNIIYKFRQRPVLPAFLISYLLVVLIWPWPPGRFLIPFLPLLLAFLFDGLTGCLTKFNIFKENYLPMLLLGSLLLYSNLIMVYRSYQKNQHDSYPCIKLNSACPPWSAYQEIFTWVKEHTHPGEIIGSGLDTMFYLYTGRQSFRPFVMQPLALFYIEGLPSSGIREFKTYLEHYHADYIIQTPMPCFEEEKPFNDLIREVEALYPDWLTLVFQGQNKQFRIFRVHPEMAP